MALLYPTHSVTDDCQNIVESHGRDKVQFNYFGRACCLGCLSLMSLSCAQYNRWKDLSTFQVGALPAGWLGKEW